jgi:hypothetical protein
VIGAGIRGLAARVSLLQAGFDAHVYERARGLHEVGAGIQVSPEARDHLREDGRRGMIRVSTRVTGEPGPVEPMLAPENAPGSAMRPPFVFPCLHCTSRLKRKRSAGAQGRSSAQGSAGRNSVPTWGSSTVSPRL